MRKIILNQRNRNYALEQVRQAPDGFEITIKKYQPKKTNAQLRLAFKWVSEIQAFFADHGNAYTTDQVRAWLNDLFLQPKISEVNGKSIEIPVSWARMERKEFSEFMDKIDRHCVSEFGLYLTMPGQQDEA